MSSQRSDGLRQASQIFLASARASRPAQSLPSRSSGRPWIAQRDAPKLVHQQQAESQRGEVRAALGLGKRRGDGRVVVAKSPIAAGDLVELPGRPGNLAVLLQIVRFRTARSCAECEDARGLVGHVVIRRGDEQAAAQLREAGSVQGGAAIGNAGARRILRHHQGPGAGIQPRCGRR